MDYSIGRISVACESYFEYHVRFVVGLMAIELDFRFDSVSLNESDQRTETHWRRGRFVFVFLAAAAAWEKNTIKWANESRRERNKLKINAKPIDGN